MLSAIFHKTPSRSILRFSHTSVWGNIPLRTFKTLIKPTLNPAPRPFPAFKNQSMLTHTANTYRGRRGLCTKPQKPAAAEPTTPPESSESDNKDNESQSRNPTYKSESGEEKEMGKGGEEVTNEDASDFLDIRGDTHLEKRVKDLRLPEVHVEYVDEDKELEKTERGRIVRERRIFLKEYDIFVEEQRYGSMLVILGITLFVVGSWSLMVPLYKLICEKYGFSLKSHQVDYEMTHTTNDVFRKWRIKFEGVLEDDIPWMFEPEQKRIKVNAGETALAFYKAYNDSDKPIVGLSIYQVDPNEASIYFNKIQCFCFENQLLHPKEYVDLPVFFYIDPLINRDPSLESVKELTVTYHFFPASDQTIAEVVQRELEKHEKGQEELKIKREKYGVTKEEREGIKDDFSALPAFNPRRRSERALRQIRALQKEQENEEEGESEDEDEDEGDSQKTGLDHRIFTYGSVTTDNLKPQTATS